MKVLFRNESNKLCLFEAASISFERNRGVVIEGVSEYVCNAPALVSRYEMLIRNGFYQENAVDFSEYIFKKINGQQDVE